MHPSGAVDDRIRIRQRPAVVGVWPEIPNYRNLDAIGKRGSFTAHDHPHTESRLSSETRHNASSNEPIAPCHND